MYETYTYISDELEHSKLWQSIIEQWIKNNKEYLEVNDFEDSCYWHNEMANVSCLIGAIWKTGGVAVAEYSVLKDEKKEGRADIYFKKDTIPYIVEAKYIKKKLTRSNIESEIKEAIKNCNSSRNDSKIKNYMSIVFAVPVNDNSDINIEELEDYDIKVKLKIIGDKKLTYEENSYNTVYLLGKYSQNEFK